MALTMRARGGRRHVLSADQIAAYYAERSTAVESQGRIVKAVARSIRTCIDVDLAGEIDFAWAERTNHTGWNVEIPSRDKAAAALGFTVRHEGITLSDRELVRAWELAQR